jgi:glycerophosphoryl diester phosphodiesterase
MTSPRTNRRFDLQGHRGARGLAPENTLPAFALAMDLGVTTLELDTAVTSDGVVVVAHDRCLNPDITRDGNGNWISVPNRTVHSLRLSELKEFDVGRINPASRYAQRFPEQKGMDGVSMPTLSEVFELVQLRNNTSIRFNIETKLSPSHPEEAPEPVEFVDILLDTIRSAQVLRRVTIQSFDWRTLHIARRLEPDICVSYLTTQQSPGATIVPGQDSPWTDGIQHSLHGSVPRMIAAASRAFGSNRDGVIWSPHFADIDRSLVDESHALNIAVLPWTLNVTEEFERAVHLGVDGLITDYPDRARSVLGRMGITLPESPAPTGGNRTSRPHG